MPHVIHDFLQEGVEARPYQLRSLERILSFSTLMVMPTGFGKTAVQWMAMAEFLRRGTKKIVLVAPTIGLVDQQSTMARERLKIDPTDIVTYTGDTSPELRRALWTSGRIIMATPQVIRNDALSGVIDLSEVGLLILDEAHHATGNHAYAQVGQIYQRSNANGRILAATASPGATYSQVVEVQSNLKTNNLDLCRRDDPFMQAYDVDMTIHVHRIDLPEALATLISPLQSHFELEVEHLKHLGFLPPKEYIGTNDIERAQQSTSKAIANRDVRGYDAARRVADLRRVHIVMNLLQTQGTMVAKDFLDRAEIEGREGRKTNRMLSLPVVHELRLALKNIDELHPKRGIVEELVKHELSVKPEGKVLIFTEYRDSVHQIVAALSSFEGLRPDVFIGQSSRGQQKGMTQKEQLGQLEKFRQGDINILVATSVGEEGLDVPAADLVILYEPVPSAVRAIQRRGRTARQRAGSVHMLVTNDTKDAYVHRASQLQEANMHTLLQKMVGQKKLIEAYETDPNALDSFAINDEGKLIPAAEYLQDIIDALPKLSPSINEPSIPNRAQQKTSTQVAQPLTPEQLRPRAQTGILQFDKNLTQQSQKFPSQTYDIILNAADQEINALNDVKGEERTILIDHREGQSTLPAYLHSLGFKTRITRLPIGDIRLSERVLIERKTASDLLVSIKNGRLLHQCQSLRISARRPLLLIETGGEGQYGMHPNAVLGALAFVTLDLGIPVMMVKDAKEAAHFVAVAAKREHDALAQLHDFVRDCKIDEDHIKTRLNEVVKELDSIEENPEGKHPWLDSAVEHLHRCFTHALEPLFTKHPEQRVLLMSFSPDIGSLFGSTQTQLMQRTGCSAQQAETILSILHEGLKSR